VIGVYGTVYNSVDTVSTTLEDLRRKLRDDFVVVVTDNYSTDGTYESLSEYDFVVPLRVRATRGRGRQIALEYLIREYGDSLDYVFSLDLDVVFPNYFWTALTGIMSRYSEGEVYGSFASAQTYSEILLRGVEWPDLNMAEDVGYDIELIRAGFRKYLLGFPFWYNQVRPARERKYARGFRYWKRMFDIYIRASLLYKHVYLPLRVGRLFAIDYLMDNAAFLFPEDVGVDSRYLAAWAVYSKMKLPKSLYGALSAHPGEYRALVARGKDRLTYQFLVYRDADAVSSVIKFFKTFHGGRVRDIDVSELL